MARFACSISMLLAFLRVHRGACSETCSSRGDATADCEPRASRSLLQQEKHKLQAVGLEPSGVSPPSATAKRQSRASSKLLYRVFDSPKGKQLGVDVSLLETAFAKHKGALQHSEAKALVHSSTKGRIDPKGMQRHVQEELLPMAETTRQELQEEINSAMEAVTNCSTLMWDAEKALSHREKILNTDQEEEYGCLIQENEANHAMKEACDRVSKMIKTLSETEPTKVKDLKNKSAANVLPAMKVAKDFFTEYHAQFESVKYKCENLTAAAAEKHKTCEVDKEVVEKFYCYMKEGRDKACADYSKCFQEATANYKEVKERVEKTETINKEHFTQMACSSWVKETTPACDILDTAHLDVRYPEEPMQGTCVPMMKFHGRGEHKFSCEEKPEPASEETSVEESDESDTVEEPLINPLPESGNASNLSEPLVNPLPEEAEATSCPVVCLGGGGNVKTLMCGDCKCAGCAADLFTARCNGTGPPPACTEETEESDEPSSEETPAPASEETEEGDEPSSEETEESDEPSSEETPAPEEPSEEMEEKSSASL